jgi:hypothetical protein
MRGVSMRGGRGFGGNNYSNFDTSPSFSYFSGDSNRNPMIQEGRWLSGIKGKMGRMAGLGDFNSDVSDAEGSGISSTDDAGNQYYTNGAIYSPGTDSWYFPNEGQWYAASNGLPIGATSSAPASTATVNPTSGVSTNSTSTLQTLSTFLESIVPPTLTALQQSNLATLNAQLVAEGKTPLTPSEYLTSPGISIASSLPTMVMYGAIAFVAIAFISRGGGGNAGARYRN